MTETYSCLNLASVQARTAHDPYNYMIADAAIQPRAVAGLRADFPDIRKTGFFPGRDISTHGGPSRSFKKALKFG